MPSSQPSRLQLHLSQLGRWPRRIAALCCLLLALATATSARQRAAQPAPSPAPGQVTVRVVLADGGAGVDIWHPGDHVDLLAAADTSTGSFALPSTSPDGLSDGGTGPATASASRINDAVIVRVQAPSGGTLTGASQDTGTVLVVAVQATDGADIAAITTLGAHPVLATASGTQGTTAAPQDNSPGSP